MKRIIFLVFLLFSLEGCTRVKIIGANFPSLFSEQVGNFDIAYGEKDHQKLDVYYPKNYKQDSPVIVFFYGGRWQYGSKNDYRFVADAFTERGYVVVIADYIKYPAGKYPAFVQDGAAAVRWTADNIYKYYGDDKKIYVLGHSAGAYIGAMLAANNKFGVKKHIKAFAGLGGAYNLRFKGKYKEEFDPIFDNPKNYDLISVTHYVRKTQPPMFLAWGEDDKTLPRKQMEILEAAIKKRGGKVQTKTYSGIDHVGIVATLSQVRRTRAPVVDDVDAFFKGKL